jgi:hypothetical protein
VINVPHGTRTKYYKEVEKMFEEFNTRVQTVREGVNTEELPFAKIGEFEGETIKVDGFFFTKGQFGEQVVVVGNGYKINMPGWCVDDFKKFRDTDAILKNILEGHLSLTEIKRSSTKKGYTYSFKYTDC